MPSTRHPFSGWPTPALKPILFTQPGAYEGGAIMRWTYSCPKCHAMLNPDETVVLVGQCGAHRILVGFHPEPGTYRAYLPPGFRMEHGALWDFFCPVCNEKLQAESSPVGQVNTRRSSSLPRASPSTAKMRTSIRSRCSSSCNRLLPTRGALLASASQVPVFALSSSPRRPERARDNSKSGTGVVDATERMADWQCFKVGYPRGRFTPTRSPALDRPWHDGARRRDGGLHGDRGTEPP